MFRAMIVRSLAMALEDVIKTNIATTPTVIRTRRIPHLSSLHALVPLRGRGRY
jgi:hypothetical protein